MNNNHTVLRRLAIQAAKLGDWDKAAQLNQDIIEVDETNVAALNRLGMAYLQRKKNRLAKEAFDQVLEIDKTNVIAKKQLSKIKNKTTVVAPTFSSHSFIEEPGKTKTVDLHRLAGKAVLLALSVGQICEMKSKNRFISIEVDGLYVGALPEDISFRLTKLMNSGNRYSCLIQSSTDNTCKVYIREEVKSKKNSQVHSFPPGKLALANQELDERYLFDDDAGVDVTKKSDEEDEGENDKDDFLE